jgi:hypothetical protein
LVISQDDWNLACIRNPDSRNYTPVAVTGAESLQARAVLQQEQADWTEKQTKQIWDTIDLLERRRVAASRHLLALRQKHHEQTARLLKVMRYVEVARCLNAPQQPAEIQAHQRLDVMKKQIDELTHQCHRLCNMVIDDETVNITRLVPVQGGYSSGRGRPGMSTPDAATAKNKTIFPATIPPELERQWKNLLAMHRSHLSDCTERIRHDQRDLKLIQDRVESWNPPRIGSTTM